MPANVGDTGSISGSQRSPGEGNDNPLQYSCLGNPMVRGAWWATVHKVTELDTTERLTFFLPETQTRVTDFYSREGQGYDSETSALVTI